jgi:hypothetical protein
MATATKKEEAYPWKDCASSGHTTNLKQSILRLSISMVLIDTNVLGGEDDPGIQQEDQGLPLPQEQRTQKRTK